MVTKIVPRPNKKSEFKIYFVTRQAEKGWNDLLATRRNDLVDAWHFLSSNPFESTPLSYRLKGQLSKVSYQGVEYDRWQLKFSLKHGSRIWYWVDGDSVYIENVFTSHPNQTK